MVARAEPAATGPCRPGTLPGPARVMPPWWRLLPLLALAACQAGGDDAREALQAARDINRASLEAVRADTRSPVPTVTTPPLTTSPADAAAEAGRRPLPPLPPQVPSAVPAASQPAPRPAGPPPESVAELMGADPAAVLRALGQPRLRRGEGAGEVWLYVGPNCHLDLVLYAEGDGAPRVAHAQARADGATPRTETECLAGISRRAS